MTIMIQVSPRDAAGTLYNLKSEADEPNVAWADFGAILSEIGGSELAQTVRGTLARILAGGDPLAQAVAVAQPLVQPQPEPEPGWGFPPVPPIGQLMGAPQPTYQQPQQQTYQQPPQMPAAAIPQAPVCQHGAKQYKSGTGAKGPWAFWGCTARSDDPTKCEKEWIRS